jgi:ankyrin repeat protein
MFKMFLDYGARQEESVFDSKGESILTKAITSKNVDLVKSLVGRKMCIFTPNARGMTPLAIAVDMACKQEDYSYGMQMVKMLLDGGAAVTINDLDSSGTTILRRAVENELPCGDIATLVEAGANPYIVNTDGETALSVSQLWKNNVHYEEVVYKRRGRTELVAAPLPSEWTDVVLALLRFRSPLAPAALDKDLEDGYNFLNSVVCEDDDSYSLTEAIVNAGANVNIAFPYHERDQYSLHTPLSYLLAKYGPLFKRRLESPPMDLIRSLVAAGATLPSDLRDKSIADVAEGVKKWGQYFRSELLTQIVLTGSPIDFLYETGWGSTTTGLSPLMFACKVSDTKGVAALLKRGATVDFRDARKRTALFYAVQADKAPELVRMLVEAGADVHAEDEDGATALMGAAVVSKAAVEAVLSSSRLER